MNSGKRYAFVLLGILSLLSSPAWSDAVYLDDGSILKGEVKLLRDDKLSLHTSYAGDLEIPRKKIVGLETDQLMTVRLQEGEEFNACFDVTDDGVLLLVRDSQSEQQLQFSQLADVRPVDAPSPEIVANAASIADEKELDDIWSGRIQAGIDGSSGNSDNRTIDVRLMAKRETENNRLSLEGLLHKASQDGEQTEDESRALIRNEQDFSERAFVFAEAEAERDQFEDVDVRYRLTVGPGYFLLQQPEHELKTRLGLGFEQERFEGGKTNNNFVLTLGYDYRLDLWEWFRLTHEFTAIPDIGDEPTKNYRLESLLGGELPLGSKESLWRLRGELRHDYNNNPEPGIEDLDTNYILSILRDFW